MAARGAGSALVDVAEARLPGRELHDLLASARSESPAAPARILGQPAYLVGGYADLKAFFADDANFPGGVVYQFQVEPSVGRTFISMDGDEHRLYRQLAMPAFRSRAAIRFVERDLVPLAHEIVDGFADTGEVDLVRAFTGVLPFWAISRKVGLPVGTESRQRRWALALLSHPVDPAAAAEAKAAVTAFLEPIFAERRREPRDDVLSHLLTAEHQGVRLSDEEVVSHIRLLYAVGATTTSDAMSSLFRTLLTQPGLYERVRDEPEVRPRLVHELLRWEPPVAILPRMASSGGEIGGVEIPPGSIVLAGISGANRDPEVFEEPDRFDVDRRESEILTFGFGAKFCPGSHLARHQLLAALDVVCERFPNLRFVDGSEPAGGILRSVERLRVAWDPA